MFHGMPCLESKNNGLFYVLPQVSYSPPASYSCGSCFKSAYCEQTQCQPRIYWWGHTATWPGPSQELCRQPCHLTRSQPGSLASISAPQPASAAESDLFSELKMMHLCGWISGDTGNLWFMMQYRRVRVYRRYRQPSLFFFFWLATFFSYEKVSFCQKLGYSAAVHKSCCR